MKWINMADSKAKIIISAEDRTKQAFDRVAGSLTAITALAGTAVVAGMLAAVKSTAKLNDEMIKAAQSVGTTTESLSGLKYAAELGGVEFEQLSVALGKLAKSTEDYRDGLSTSVDAFKKIKLDPTQFKDTSQLFEAVAEQLSKLPDGAQKTAIAMALLGKSGAKLIPLMNGGAAGIKAAREEAEKLGVIISTKAAKASEEFNDNLTKLQTGLHGLTIELAGPIIPKLNELTTSLLEAKKAGEGFYGTLFVLGSDQNNIDDRLSEVENRLLFLKKKKDALSQPSFANSIGFNNDDIAILTAQIKTAEQELRSLANLKQVILARTDKNEGSNRKPNLEEDRKAFDKLTEKSSKAKSTGKSPLEKQREDLAKLIDEFERAAKPTQTQAETLQETLDNYGKLDPAVKKYLDGVIKQIELTDQLKQQQSDYAELEALQRTSDDEALRQMEELSAAEQDRIANMQEQALAIKELFDPTLKLLNIQAEYDNLLNDGLITQEEYNYALKKAQESTSELADQNKKDMDSIKRAVEGTFNDARDSVVDFAFGADVAVSDMVKNMLKSLAQLALQRSIIDPLSQGLDGIFSGMGNSSYTLLPSFVPSYDVGTNYVPQDQLAMVHKGERIIPASMNNSGYGSTNVSVHVDATGGSVQGDTKKATELGKQIEGAMRAVLIKEKRPGGLLA
jgi:hypothetical protein